MGRRPVDYGRFRPRSSPHARTGHFPQIKQPARAFEVKSGRFRYLNTQELPRSPDESVRSICRVKDLIGSAPVALSQRAWPAALPRTPFRAADRHPSPSRKPGISQGLAEIGPTTDALALQDARMGTSNAPGSRPAYVIVCRCAEAMPLKRKRASHQRKSSGSNRLFARRVSIAMRRNISAATCPPLRSPATQCVEVVATRFWWSTKIKTERAASGGLPRNTIRCTRPKRPILCSILTDASEHLQPTTHGSGTAPIPAPCCPPVSPVPQGPGPFNGIACYGQMW